MLTTAIIIAACVTPVWFAVRIIHRGVRNHRRVNAWERHLNS